MSPIIHPDVWQNSQLSIVRHTGAIRVNGRLYYVLRSGYLVCDDYCGAVSSLGAETARKAIIRFGDTDYTLKVLKRLVRLVRARRKASMCNDAVLF